MSSAAAATDSPSYIDHLTHDLMACGVGESTALTLSLSAIRRAAGGKSYTGAQVGRENQRAAREQMESFMRRKLALEEGEQRRIEHAEAKQRGLSPEIAKALGERLEHRLVLAEGLLLTVQKAQPAQRERVHGAVEALLLQEIDADDPAKLLQDEVTTAKFLLEAVALRPRRDVQPQTNAVPVVNMPPPGEFYKKGHGSKKDGGPRPHLLDLQERLNALGLKVAVDGWMGEQTEAAIKHFQKEHGLDVTGELDATTVRTLRAAQPLAEPQTFPVGSSQKDEAPKDTTKAVPDVVPKAVPVVMPQAGSKDPTTIKTDDKAVREASYVGVPTGTPAKPSTQTRLPYGGITPFLGVGESPELPDPPPNLRVATDLNESCNTCVHFSGKASCDLYDDYGVAATDTCDSQRSVMDALDVQLQEAVEQRKAASGDSAEFARALARERVLRLRVEEAMSSMAKATIHEPVGKPGGPGLWGHKGLQLPAYIQHIANDIREGGKSTSSAIAIAVATVKKWCRGGGNVKPDTRAAACKAAGEWEKLKATHRGSAGGSAKGLASKAKGLVEAEDDPFAEIEGIEVADEDIPEPDSLSEAAPPVKGRGGAALAGPPGAGGVGGGKYQESKHVRTTKGRVGGGQFASKGGPQKTGAQVYGRTGHRSKFQTDQIHTKNHVQRHGLIWGGQVFHNTASFKTWLGQHGVSWEHFQNRHGGAAVGLGAHEKTPGGKKGPERVWGKAYRDWAARYPKAAANARRKEAELKAHGRSRPKSGERTQKPLGQEVKATKPRPTAPRPKPARVVRRSGMPPGMLGPTTVRQAEEVEEAAITDRLGRMFRPEQHLRDRIGRFEDMLKTLKHGESARLPSGVRVQRDHMGYHVAPRKPTKSTFDAARTALGMHDKMVAAIARERGPHHPAVTAAMKSRAEQMGVGSQATKATPGTLLPEATKQRMADFSASRERIARLEGQRQRAIRAKQRPNALALTREIVRERKNMAAMAGSKADPGAGDATRMYDVGISRLGPQHRITHQYSVRAAGELEAKQRAQQMHRDDYPKGKAWTIDVRPSRGGGVEHGALPKRTKADPGAPKFEPSLHPRGPDSGVTATRKLKRAEPGSTPINNVTSMRPDGTTYHHLPRTEPGAKADPGTKRTTASDYLSEKVEYGGQMITRGEMQADLERIARSAHPNDPAEQRRVVERYMQGNAQRERVLGQRTAARARVMGEPGATTAEVHAAGLSTESPEGRGMLKGTEPDYSGMSISELAGHIQHDWGSQGKGVNFAAKPYLEAMHGLSGANDTYGMDSGKAILAYFLSNAGSWKGPKAKAIKAELKKHMKMAGRPGQRSGHGLLNEADLDLRLLEAVAERWAAGEDGDTALFQRARATEMALRHRIEERDIGMSKRHELAKRGAAMKDKSYPTETAGDLDNAIQAWGRSKPGKRAALKRYLMRRAKALGAGQGVIDRISALSA